MAVADRAVVALARGTATARVTAVVEARVMANVVGLAKKTRKRCLIALTFRRNAVPEAAKMAVSSTSAGFARARAQVLIARTRKTPRRAID